MHYVYFLTHLNFFLNQILFCYTKLQVDILNLGHLQSWTSKFSIALSVLVREILNKCTQELKKTISPLRLNKTNPKPHTDSHSVTYPGRGSGPTLPTITFSIETRARCPAYRKVFIKPILQRLR